MSKLLFSRRAALKAGAVSVITSAIPALAPAQNRAPVRIIGGYASGGLVDSATRVIAEAIGPLMAQPVIVEAKPGANGSIAAEFVKNSAPDGTTLLLNGLPHITNSAIGTPMRWSIDDFAGVGFLSRQPSLIVVPAELGVKTLKEFVALSKKSPGKLNFLNGGDGTISHLVPELLRHKYGVDITNVPYKGSAPGIPDLLTNRVQMAVVFNSIVEPHLASGKLVALAMVDEARAASLPLLPTISEAGFPEALVTSRWFLLAPAKTPTAVLDSLSEKLQKALSDPATRSKFDALGMVTVAPGPHAEVDRYIRNEVNTWKTFFKDSGLKFN